MLKEESMIKRICSFVYFMSVTSCIVYGMEKTSPSELQPIDQFISEPAKNSSTHSTSDYAIGQSWCFMFTPDGEILFVDDSYNNEDKKETSGSSLNEGDEENETSNSGDYEDSRSEMSDYSSDNDADGESRASDSDFVEMDCARYFSTNASIYFTPERNRERARDFQSGGRYEGQVSIDNHDDEANESESASSSAGNESREDELTEEKELTQEELIKLKYEGSSSEMLRVYAFNAVMFRELETLEELLFYSPEIVFLTNNEGDTLLHWAAKKTDCPYVLSSILDVVEKHGISLLAKVNRDGYTPLQILAQRNYFRFESILKKIIDLQQLAILTAHTEMIEEELERARERWLGIRPRDASQTEVAQKQEKDTLACDEEFEEV